MKSLGSLLSGLVFLHALLTAPLLVECIAADGRYLVEILGHDPCHGARDILPPAASQGQNPTVVSASEYKTDPCMDLIVDGPSVTETCRDVSPAPLHVPEEIAGAAHAGLQVVFTLARYRPDREPFLLCRCGIPSVLTLRI